MLTFRIAAIAWLISLAMAAVSALVIEAEADAAAEVSAQAPRLFVLDPGSLTESRRRLQSGDESLSAALNKLKRDADRAHGSKMVSVTQKDLTPPSGDKHDYMSIAPYWWPYPNTPNGLPYVRRDGEINPERDQVSDRKRMENVVQATKTLGLAYFFSNREDYAERSSKLLRVWFMDDATKMNPHLRYAQSIPGRNQGRGAGVIETHNMAELIDAVGLQSGSIFQRRVHRRESWNRSMELRDTGQTRHAHRSGLARAICHRQVKMDLQTNFGISAGETRAAAAARRDSLP